MATRINLFLISMESRSQAIFLSHVSTWCYFCIHPLQIYTNYALQIPSCRPHSVINILFPWMITYLACYGRTLFTGSKAWDHSTSLISSVCSLSHDHCILYRWSQCKKYTHMHLYCYYLHQRGYIFLLAVSQKLLHMFEKRIVGLLPSCHNLHPT